MNEVSMKMDELKQEVRALSGKLDALADEAGHSLADKTGQVFFEVKRGLQERLSSSRQTPVQAALIALGLGLIRQLETIADRSWQSLAERSRAAFSRIKDTLEERVETALETSKRAGDRIESYAEENPAQAAALALALALLIGKAVHSVSRTGQGAGA